MKTIFLLFALFFFLFTSCEKELNGKETVAGIVEDSNGSPLSDAQVILYVRGTDALGDNILFETSSDANGEFEVEYKFDRDIEYCLIARLDHYYNSCSSIENISKNFGNISTYHLTLWPEAWIAFHVVNDLADSGDSIQLIYNDCWENDYPFLVDGTVSPDTNVIIRGAAGSDWFHVDSDAPFNIFGGSSEFYELPQNDTLFIDLTY